MANNNHDKNTLQSLLSGLHHNTFTGKGGYVVLFTAQHFFWPCVLIKDTYRANYSSLSAKSHIFSPLVRSHWHKHLQTKEETRQTQLAELLSCFEAAWEWFILKTLWLSLAKPQEIYFDAWSMTEQYQTEVQVVVHWHLWERTPTAEPHRHSEVLIYQSLLRLRWNLFMLMWRSTSFRCACSYGACMGVDTNTQTQIHTHTKEVHSAEQWNQTDNDCWDNTQCCHRSDYQQTYTHIHTHIFLPFTTWCLLHVSDLLPLSSFLCLLISRSRIWLMHSHMSTFSSHSLSSSLRHTDPLYKLQGRPKLQRTDSTWSKKLNTV